MNILEISQTLFFLTGALLFVVLSIIALIMGAATWLEVKEEKAKKLQQQSTPESPYDKLGENFKTKFKTIYADIVDNHIKFTMLDHDNSVAGIETVKSFTPLIPSIDNIISRLEYEDLLDSYIEVSNYEYTLMFSDVKAIDIMKAIFRSNNIPLN
jgi:predicted RND superfamily exporter protein